MGEGSVMQRLSVIDSHTGGEPIRVVLGGLVAADVGLLGMCGHGTIDPLPTLGLRREGNRRIAKANSCNQ